MPNRKTSISALAAAAAMASKAVTETDESLAKARQEVAGLHNKAQPLRDQLAELQAHEPMQVGPNEAHVEALLANPAAAPDQEEITAAISAARKQEDVRQMTIATVQAAIGKINEELAVVEAFIAERSEARIGLWFDFVCASGEYLSRLFRERFEQLRDDALAPMIALANLRDQAGNKILPGGTRVAKVLLDRGSVILREYDREAEKYNDQKLFEDTAFMASREAELLVLRFRADLDAAT